MFNSFKNKGDFFAHSAGITWSTLQ